MAKAHVEKYREHKAKIEAEIERKFLKGEKDEDLGIYCNLFSAKSSIKGQDGGVVSELLVEGFKTGLFDVAIVVQGKEGYGAKVVVAQRASDILAAKGTKYLKVNVTKKLRELISQGKKRIAIVCTPCEVSAARKIQQTLKSDCEITIIGLFCFEAFKGAKLKEEVKELLGVDLDKAEKTQIRQGKFTAQVDGNEVSCKVKDLESAVEKACCYCDDFTSQLADVSVGSVGSKQEYSTVVVRSEAGEKLIENLDCVREAVDKEEIVKLSKSKKKRAKESFTVLNSPQ